MKMIVATLVFIQIAFAQEFLPVDKINPFTAEEFTHIKIGETYMTGRFGKRYLNRAITLYNTFTHEDILEGAPSFQEECYEYGDRFANWSYTKSFQRSISLGLSFNLLGIDIGTDGSLTRSFDLSIERWVHATKGVQAVHTPFMRYESYKGITYIQQIDLRTHKTYNIQLENPDFFVNYINPTIYVKRKVLQECAENL